MDMKEKKDNSIERLFALSRDAVLGLRQETVIFANPAAEALLGNYGLPTLVPYSLDALSDAVLSDKKIVSGTVSLVVPHAIGRCELHRLPAEELSRWLAAGGAV